MVINNVNTDELAKFAAEVGKNPDAAKKIKRVVGEWTLEAGQPQFRARVEYPKGADILEADTAPFMGGTGIKPDPVQYCLYGLAACYASTFAAIAAGEGVALGKLVVAAENQVDLSRSLGLSNNAIVECVTITATVQSNADKDKLEQMERLTRERCPGVYCLTNPIPLTTKLIIE